MCGKAVCIEPLLMIYIPDHLKTKEMCQTAIEKRLRGLYYVPNPIAMLGMHIKVVAFNPYALRFVPDHFKTQDICYKSVPQTQAP